MADTKKEGFVSVDIYFDYLCPYVYRAAIWLKMVKEEIGHKLTVNWRYFSLEQVNSEQGAKWKIWKQPGNYPSRGLWAFRAAEAARRQGEVFFDSLHVVLLEATHEQGRDIADINILIELARGIGLDIGQFQKDINSRGVLARLAKDHTVAVETLGVFGTPTLVFPGEKPVFLKLVAPPPPSDSLDVFDEIRRISEHMQYITEIKRP